MTKEQTDAVIEVLKVMIKNRARRELLEMDNEIAEYTRRTSLKWDDVRGIAPSAMEEVLEDFKNALDR